MTLSSVYVPFSSRAKPTSGGADIDLARVKSDSGFWSLETSDEVAETVDKPGRPLRQLEKRTYGCEHSSRVINIVPEGAGGDPRREAASLYLAEDRTLASISTRVIADKSRSLV